MTFATILKNLRQRAGLSQRSLASVLNIDHTYISKLENGTTDYPPKESLIRQIASRFNVDGDWLVFAAGRIPSKYDALLTELALQHGERLPQLLEDLKKSNE